MGNISSGLKKFLSNKNTVTVVGIVVAIFVLYFAYNWRVNQATNPVTVPYARQQISPGTQITESMVGTRQVPPSMLEGDVVRSASAVIDKYSNADTLIPAGSLFYERQVVEKEQLPANIILSYPNGYVLYNMSVNTQTTYGNSVYPGNYIDIYVKIVERRAEGQQQSNFIRVSKLLENVKVLAVKDASGQAVFANLDEQRTPSMVVFAVPSDMFILLTKTENLGSYSAELIPVPTNESLKENPGEVAISSEELVNYINEITVVEGTGQ